MNVDDLNHHLRGIYWARGEVFVKVGERIYPVSSVEEDEDGDYIITADVSA